MYRRLFFAYVFSNLSDAPTLPVEEYPDVRALIEDVVSYDPRPSFRRGRDEERIYGANLYDLNVRFRFVNDDSKIRVEVISVC